MLRIGIVAGEASGDFLGAHLIKALKAEHGEIVVEGIGGRKMQAEGCRSIFPMEKLAVMGLVEVLGSYIELLGIRRRLIRHFLECPPDIFIGIDAPDFNLGLERCLKEHGITTVHYVSPSVWAWRRYRLHKIAAAVDLMLTLFPFEPAIYRQHNIRAEYVGHPLAGQIALQPDTAGARQGLGIEARSTVIGIMPGSRKSELRRLLPPFLQAAELCRRQNRDALFACSLLDSGSIDYFRKVQARLGLQELPVMLYQDRAHEVLAAVDVVLLASGTVTLEAMLFKKPMVVAYKLNPVTHLLVKMMTYIDHAALPNLLEGRQLVPECLQYDCKPEILFAHLQHWLQRPGEVLELQERFSQIHVTLKKDSGELAARAIFALLERP